MNRILCACVVLACLAPLLGAAAPEDPGPAKAFFNARRQQTEYAGPGREDQQPAAVDEVLIGYFGPGNAADPEGGDLWCAAQMAVEEANQRGGHQGKPYRLVAAWSDSPWGAGVGQLARLVFQDRVWAIIGGIDGPSTHLAEQVVAKAGLVLLSPAATDKTANLANVPWMFSCLPGDHLLAPVLAAGISARVGKGPFLVASADDHDAHLFADELKKCLAKQGVAPRYHFEFGRGSQDVAELAARIAESKVDAAVIVAGAPDSARLLAAVRTKGFAGTVFGGPAMGRRRFADEAGRAAEGVVFPLLYHPEEASAPFAKAFEGRFGKPPDYAAAHTYDAVRLLVEAIGKAGLNRARIGDAVRDLSPWSGVTGTMTWDGLGGNCRTVRLGTIRGGRIAAAEAKADALAGAAEAK